jgi:hypothetical protein
MAASTSVSQLRRLNDIMGALTEQKSFSPAIEDVLLVRNIETTLEVKLSVLTVPHVLHIRATRHRVDRYHPARYRGLPLFQTPISHLPICQ